MKNKCFFPILLLVSAFIISGCNNANPSTSGSSGGSGDGSAPVEPPAAQPLKREVIINVDPMLKTTGGDIYHLSFDYDDEYFLSSAKTYNQDLSMLSYGVSLATATARRGANFFMDTKFEDISIHDYDSKPTKDSMGYFLAHKSIGESELFVVAFRGFNYGLEWTNNFLIGKTGNHEGFNARGEEAYQALQDYIAKYAKDRPLKLWINGYSRAGAVSNVLSSLILKDNKVNVTQDNMFVYTFEAPASLIEENAIAYENVHNIINKADLVASIPPKSYGLYRCGVDYQIYDENVSALIKQFDPAAEFPEFIAIDDLTEEPINSDTDFLNYCLDTVFNKEETSSDTTIYVNTREQYVDNYQAGLSSCIGYIFGLKDSTRSQLLTDLTGLGFGALSIIGDQTGEELLKFIKPYLDKDKVSYNEEQLLSDCAIFIKAVGNLFLTILLIYISDQYSPDLVRLIDMHFPETTYVLLKNAHSK